jgi:hypothetical protein
MLNLTPGEKLSHIAALSRTEGWGILVERYRRNQEVILRRLLDGSTSDTDTIALKRAYVFMEENDPQKLVDSLSREFRAKDKSDAGMSNPTA